MATPAVTPRAAARFLIQATWRPTPASIAQVQSMGFNNWLEAQFALNTSDLPDQPLLNAGGTPSLIRTSFRQRVAFVLSQLWVVSHKRNTICFGSPS
jgi:hypothetical protein